MIPCNSNIFFVPNTKSTFSCISKINVKMSNLWPCISLIIGMMNKTLMNCPFPTYILCVVDTNLVMNVRICNVNNVIWT